MSNEIKLNKIDETKFERQIQNSIFNKSMRIESI